MLKCTGSFLLTILVLCSPAWGGYPPYALDPVIGPPTWQVILATLFPTITIGLGWLGTLKEKQKLNGWRRLEFIGVSLVFLFFWSVFFVQYKKLPDFHSPETWGEIVMDYLIIVGATLAPIVALRLVVFTLLWVKRGFSTANEQK